MLSLVKEGDVRLRKREWPGNTVALGSSGVKLQIYHRVFCQGSSQKGNMAESPAEVFLYQCVQHVKLAGKTGNCGTAGKL